MLDVKLEFEQSRVVKSKVARFEQEPVDDFKNLEHLLDSMIHPPEGDDSGMGGVPAVATPESPSGWIKDQRKHDHACG